MKKLSLLIILSALLCCGLKAQSTIETTDSGAIIVNIDIKKPKSVQKLLKEKDLSNVTKIKINGPVTEKDIQYIFASLTNLEALDMSDASLPLTYEYPKKSGNIYNYETFVLPSSSKITKLGIPESCIVLNNSATNDFDILIGKSLKKISGNMVNVSTFINNVTDDQNYRDNEFYGNIHSINFTANTITNTTIDLSKLYIKHDHIDEIPLKTMFIINKDTKSKFENGSFSTIIDSYNYGPGAQCYRYRENKNTNYATAFALITYSIDNLSYYAGHQGRRYLIDDGIEPVFLILYGKDYISLVNYDGIASNNKSVEVKLSDYEKYVKKIDEIEPYAFYGHPEITSIDLKVNGLTYLGAYAFAGTQFTSITIPESITQISPYAFDGSSIKEVIIESIYPPVIDDKYEDISKHHKEKNILNELAFIIPENSKEKFNIGRWKSLHVREAGVKTDYELIVEMPGTLNQFINDNNAQDITNLVIKGFLDDRDFEAIRKCKNLQKLDLSHCFTLISEQTQKADKEKADAEIALVAFILNASHDEAKHRYEVGTATLGDVVSTYAMKEDINKFVEAYDKKEFVADKNCKMPYDALSGLTVLKEFIYPLQLQSACVSMPESIENVVFPPLATEIGGIRNCKNLKNIIVPPSVSSIRKYTFANCIFDKLDLSETLITEFPEGCFDKSEIKVFLAPKRLKSICCGNFKVSIAYFYTQEQPNCLDKWQIRGILIDNHFEILEIHIPRGAKAGWNNMVGSKTTYLIDDILE